MLRFDWDPHLHLANQCNGHLVCPPNVPLKNPSRFTTHMPREDSSFVQTDLHPMIGNGADYPFDLLEACLQTLRILKGPLHVKVIGKGCQTREGHTLVEIKDDGNSVEHPNEW